jgi:predicted enzyme involved in methoxymalonyl-ACP biosynthesis
MSCRVMSRGVGSVFMNHILNLARRAGVELHAEFLSNDRNRMMLITYKLGGFKELKRDGKFILFRHDLERIPPHPEWLKLNLYE